MKSEVVIIIHMSILPRLNVAKPGLVFSQGYFGVVFGDNSFIFILRILFKRTIQKMLYVGYNMMLFRFVIAWKENEE